MISKRPEFRLIDRGKSDTIVLIPGWATDYRIFNNLDLNFNYLLPLMFSPSNFVSGLLSILKGYNLNKVSLFGWSMGGFMALDFLAKHPDKISKVIFVSVRKKYEKENLKNIKTYLQKSRGGYLYKFYMECFSENEKNAFVWFKKNLLKDYLKQISLDSLLEGLDYLTQAELSFERVRDVKAYFFHGREDKIAPIQEVFACKESLPEAQFISLEGAGHMPFLSAQFKRIFYEACV